MPLQEINSLLDHTCILPSCGIDDIKKAIQEAIDHRLKAVCVQPCWVKYAQERLKGTQVLLCTVIGYPHGCNDPEIKRQETFRAIKLGADELDVMMNTSFLKSGYVRELKDELDMIVAASCGRTVKVTLASPIMTKEEIIQACRIVMMTSAKYIKLSSGFYGPARLEDVKLVKSIVKDRKQIKAAGYIEDFSQAFDFIAAGADRIGSRHSLKILQAVNQTV